MGQTKILLLSSVVPITIGLCRLLPVPAGRWPFPTLSLQSLYRCLDPYPAVFLRCTCSFLPEEHRPHIRSETFGTSGLPLQCNFYKARFFGAAVIPLCSGSHTCRTSRLHLPLKNKSSRQPGRLHHAMDVRLPNTNCGIATYLNRAINMAGLSPAGLQPCRPLPR